MRPRQQNDDNDMTFDLPIKVNNFFPLMTKGSLERVGAGLLNTLCAVLLALLVCAYYPGD
jgi:hypothetical protein